MMSRRRHQRESTQHARGQNRSTPWYERFPERFEQDKASVAEHYPELSYYVSPDKQEVSLSGTLIIRDCYNVPKRVSIQILFPDSYPAHAPAVYETEGRFPQCADRHMMDDGSFCLFLPLSEELDLAGRHSIIDFLHQVEVFIDKHLVAESISRWPGGEWKHGSEGKWQYLHESIGSEDRKLVRKFMQIIREEVEIGRNQTCPCGSGRKYKYCHQTWVKKMRRILITR